MRVTERRNGTIRIEAIGTRGRESDGWEWTEDPEPIMICGPDMTEERQIRVGDEGCMVTGEDVSPDALRAGGPTEYSVRLSTDREGIPGNSDPSIRRLHGWRGTTGDWYVDTWGWRRVESIEPRKRGIGYVVILSADLRPDED